MTPDEALSYGCRVALRLCPHGGMWFDDVAAEAALGAFLAPEGSERQAGWLRGIDELRRRTHHRRPGRPPNTVTETRSLDAPSFDLDDIKLGCFDEPPFALTETIPSDVMRRLSMRDRRVLVQVAFDRPGVEIAADAGFSAARVAQVLRRVRELWERQSVLPPR